MNSLHQPDKPRLLSPEFHERIWGSYNLQPLFPNSARKIGEVWFPEPDSPVLVKFLFTTENLSVQVHPNDQLARQLGHARGKTEMWHILHAEPRAHIALGFKSRQTPNRVRQAATDGSIMEMLRWIPVCAGDSWFIPAGAVHAVGAGITLCEVQQNSDVTYRLYDYGRERELHMEESLRALDLEFEPKPISRESLVLASCPYFQVRRIPVSGEQEVSGLDLVIGLEGGGTLNGNPFTQGNAVRVRPEVKLQVHGNLQLLTVATRI